ncbi:MAG: hypothetical protein RPT25_00605 [Cycloclasticus sp.]|jgi:hypothetical protein
MVTITDIVIAVASSLSTLGLGLLFWQAKILTSQFKDDHERSRRENAIDMLKLWDSGLTQKDGVTRKFVELLDFSQSKAIFDQEEFNVEAKHWSMIRSIIPQNSKLLSEYDESNSSDKITIDENDSAHIRWILVSYLNRAETILSAWRHNIADREMIEEQFKYLVKPEVDHYILLHFRVAAGNTYPSIDDFAKHLKAQSNAVEGKPKTG